MSLPNGWIQQHDPNYDHPFWVDTRSNPPRAIWVHPYEDEQFLAEHPEPRTEEKTPTTSTLDAPPSYDAATEGCTLESTEKENKHAKSTTAVPAGENSQTEHKRGVLGRLKDKAIGTKEEREEQKRIRAVQTARAEEQARQERMRQLEEREAYMRAHGGYAPYHPSHAAGYGPYGPGSAQRPLGLDNPAMLLLGGLAGGLLLGDIFGGVGF